MKKLHYFITAFVLAIFFISIQEGECQVSRGGTPQSTIFSVPYSDGNSITLESPSMDILLAEDAKEPSPYRFGITLPVNVTTENSGIWTDLPDGSRLWRISVVAPGALAISAYFDRFHIPEGGRLYLYNPDKKQVIGAYTEMNNTSAGYFATELVIGDTITLEYDQPDGQLELPVIHLNEIGYAYKGIKSAETGDQVEGITGICEVNINCPEGDHWQQQKKGVVKIQVKKSGGLYLCSGSLVNNVRKNKVPYLLTANHCGFNAVPADILQWIFYFNYESPTCDISSIVPVPKSMTGATLKASAGTETNFGSDFYLLLLNQTIPDSMDVVYNGWTRQDTISVSGVGIHHPYGDVKKISTYTTSTVSSNYNGQPELTHWEVVWAATPNGHGVTEGGSSGSPLFDSHGRITGALTGGESNCDSANLSLPDFYGKFYYSWDKNGSDSVNCLKYWLDPDNVGPKYLDGLEVKPPPPTPPVGEPTLSIYPAQFNNSIKLHFTGIWPSAFHITFYTIIGVKVLDRDILKTSDTMEYDDAANLSAGIYVVKIRIPGQTFTHKLIKSAHTGIQ